MNKRAESCTQVLFLQCGRGFGLFALSCICFYDLLLGIYPKGIGFWVNTAMAFPGYRRLQKIKLKTVEQESPVVSAEAQFLKDTRVTSLHVGCECDLYGQRVFHNVLSLRFVAGTVPGCVGRPNPMSSILWLVRKPEKRHREARVLTETGWHGAGTEEWLQLQELEVARLRLLGHAFSPILDFTLRSQTVGESVLSA